MSIKEWIDKRIKEMKADNVIPLDNWREFYNNIQKQKDKEKSATTQTLDNSGRGETPNHKWKRT